jgi:hypothetical protein
MKQIGQIEQVTQPRPGRPERENLVAMPGRKVFHIVNVDRLRSIATSGALSSDARLQTSPAPGTSIGLDELKARRLVRPVPCHPGTTVGEFVPFYFCPRSVMLYVIYKANSPKLAYKGGQQPILHLQADLDTVIDWARSTSVRWAYSRSNAAASYTEFGTDRAGLNQLDWESIANPDFRQQRVKEAKQSELLVYESFPWTLIEAIGAYDDERARAALREIRGVSHRPRIRVERGWYY